jgi:AraC-like DNA-binding protein
MEVPMEQYLKSHLNTRYFPEARTKPGLRIYANRFGWTDYYVGKNLLFSHRMTVYDMDVFPEKLHSHPFYEMDIYEHGNISYIADNHEIIPARENIILFPPGAVHTARQAQTGEYERYVIYFDPEVFDILGGNGLSSLLSISSVSCLSVNPEQKGDFRFLLEKTEYTLESCRPDSALLSFSYLIRLFDLIGKYAASAEESFNRLPQNVLDLKEFVDNNCRDLSSTSEIADHFFYSREHVSRMFRQYFNTNISEYLTSKKIESARKSLEEGNSVTEAFSASGFHSMSSFVGVFKKLTAVTPSAYRREHCAGQKKHGSLRSSS